VHFRSATRVGFVIVLSAAAFLFVYFAILNVGQRAKGYVIYGTFRDIQNLEVGADVRMAGVPVGQVAGISLTPDSQALVSMKIRDTYQDRIPSGSRFSITAGGLIGQQYVAIVPMSKGTPLKPEATVRGYETQTFDQLISKANSFADTTNRLARQLENLGYNLNKVVKDRQLNRDLREVASNLTRTSRQGLLLLSDLRATTRASSPKLQKVLTSASETMASFGETADAMKELLTGTGGQLKGDLGDLIKTFKTTAERLDATVANLQTLSGDPRWSKDLGTLVDNLKAGSENAKEALANLKDAASSTKDAAGSFKDTADVVNARITRLLGRPKPKEDTTKAGSTPKPAGPPPAVPTSSSLEVYQLFRPGQVRVDANQTLDLGKDSFAYLGLRDIGESTKVNLQLGHSVSRSLSYRYGFYNSRLGLGGDWNLGKGDGFTANLYRPDHLTLDLYARKRLAPNLTGVLGLESVLGQNRAVLGLKFRP
jgi:phospholipid/cholesterol/gamma-HCH transport system substrate-binding protein